MDPNSSPMKLDM
jgi:hypothetical protein